MPQKLIRSILLAIAGFVSVLLLIASAEQGSQKNPGRHLDTTAPARSGYTRVNGIRIHFLEWGDSGSSIVLLHGLYDDAGVWKSLAPQLATDSHVVAPDRRGTGGSDIPKTGYDAKTLISDLAALIRNLKLGPVTLVGHSAGAEIALRVAAEHPEMIRSLIMIDGGFWPAKNMGLAATPAAPCSNPKECARWLALENASRTYNPDPLYPRVSSPALLVVARQAKPGADLLAEYQKQGINYFEQLKRAEQHVQEVADMKLPQGRMDVIDNASHWIQRDQPEALAQVIKRFLSELGHRRNIN
jgi:pimeloyl-ACP methyl ester carboxylesterase